MPPVTMTTSRPRRARPASRGRAGRAAPSESPRRRRAQRTGRGAGGPDGQLEAVGVEARDRDRRGGERRAARPSRTGPGGRRGARDRRSRRRSVTTSRVSRRTLDDDRLGAEVGASGVERRSGIERPAGPAAVVRRSATRSAVRMTAAGAAAAHRHGRRRHRQQLLADVDPDRAPGDASAAADAAGRCRTGPTTCRTCGSATGGSGPAARGRKLPPATWANPSVKQLSHVRSASTRRRRGPTPG